MTILAIESSSLVASVAITEDDVMIAEYTIDYKKTHSQTLLPMIDEMCRMTDFQLEKIDAIAVSAGPGSFTGLRIGSATAKGLGLALKKPLIHVPTVEAMAYNFYDTEKYIVPIMDARRNQVYTGIYTSHEGNVEEVVGQCILLMDELIEKINPTGRHSQCCNPAYIPCADPEMFFLQTDTSAMSQMPDCQTTGCVLANDRRQSGSGHSHIQSKHKNSIQNGIDHCSGEITKHRDLWPAVRTDQMTTPGCQCK